VGKMRIPRPNFMRLNPLARMGRRDIVSVDLSGNVMKLVHVRAYHNRREVARLITRNISGLTDIDIAKVLLAAYGELKLKSRQVIAVIPSHAVITKTIDVPSTDPKEIMEIINLQAGRHTPYSREEIIVDYINLGTHKQNYTKILLVIIARSVVKRHYEVLAKAALRVEKVAFSPEAMVICASALFKLKAVESPVGILDVDENISNFIITFKNKLLFVRSIPIGVQHLAEDKEKHQQKFSEEMRKTLEAYQSEDIEKTPASIILTGAVEELKELETVLNNTLYVPSAITPFFRNLSISAEVLKSASESKRVSFLNVITPLCAWGQVKVDLVPEEVKLKRIFLQRGKELIKTGVFSLSIVVLVFFILISKIYFKGIYLSGLDEEYSTLSEQTLQLERDFEKVTRIRNYLEGRGYSLKVLNELYNIMPIELRFNNVKFNREGKFSVRGTATSMSIVFAFVDNMKKSRYFNNVKTRYTTKRKEDDQDVTDFEIRAMITQRGG